MSDGVWIDGGWRAGAGSTVESVSPVDEAVVWRGAGASEAQVAGAVESASDCVAAWYAAGPERRAAVVGAFAEELRQHREEVAERIAREIGKPRWESRTEVDTAIAKVDASLDALAQRRSTRGADAPTGGRMVTRYRPIRALVVLGPFNFPLHLPGAHLVPALLAGNAVVFKPSEQAAAVGAWLAEAWHRAGLPPGVLNLVQGGPEVATAAIDHPRTAGVLMTGSRATGEAIHRRLAGRPEVLLALEMGGNSPLVAVPPVEPSDAARLAVMSAYISAGQRCSCARRLIVLDNQHGNEVVSHLRAMIPHIRVGLPADRPEPFVGPVISRGAAERVIRGFESWIGEGGKPLVAPTVDRHCDALVRPGLVDTTGVAVSDEEVFGPLLQVRRVPDFDTAVAEANATRYGLAAGLIGGTPEQFAAFVEQVQAGVINWNRQTTGASGRLPFGGVAASGNHRPSGYFAADYCSDPVASLEAPHAEIPPQPPPGLEALWEPAS